MMYQNKLVACIKVGGQILREISNVTTVPFGSEYSVFLKNLNSVRAQVKISIDGKDATEDTWLVIDPNSSLDLERFIRNCNLAAGNRFKFIERTKEIEAHRGVEADDGLVRIEYKFERVQKVDDVHINRYHYHDYWPYHPHPRFYPYWGSTLTSNGLQTNNNVSLNVRASSSPVREEAMKCSASTQMSETSCDAGITVPGSASSQQFQSVSGFDTHGSEVLVLRLRGEVKGKKVQKPVTTKSKMSCSTCGKKSKSRNQFCAQCGTALEVI